MHRDKHCWILRFSIHSLVKDSVDIIKAAVKYSLDLLGCAAQRSLPQKFGGCQSGNFFEQATEMVGVCEAEQTCRISYA